jgi:hypothetical protein
VRVHVIVTLVALLVLVAVPLWIWRRPHPIAAPPEASAAAATPAGDAGGAPASSAAGVASAASAPAFEGAGTPRDTLADAKPVRCSAPGAGKIAPERCDRLPAFEDALAKAIRDNPSCTPPAAASGTVSYVLAVDFKRKTTRVWLGRSGTMKGRTPRQLVRCVSKSLPPVDWAAQTQHQYQRYDVGVMATYAAPVGATNPG